MTRRLSALIAAVSLAAVTARDLDAHKPITSPFTFSADVAPVLKARCGQCHVPGGVAPMSLLTHTDAVPWGESMRSELLAGHMPPWSIDRGADRFRNGGSLTARELNVLLTWLTGGTPPGTIGQGEDTAVASPSWHLGPPDAIVALPRVTLAASEQERIAAFTLAGVSHERMLRAIDLLPGTPAIARSATVEVERPTASASVREEQLLSLWVPGDEPSTLSTGALRIPAGAALVVRVRYRKTWEDERKEMSDESRLGLYFASTAASPVQAVTLSAGVPATLTRASRAIAIYPDAALSDAAVVVTATRPDGRRQELIAFHPRRGWARRYWFREPLLLPRGTRLSVRVTPDSAALLPPGLTRPPAPANRPPARVTVNVVQ